MTIVIEEVVSSFPVVVTEQVFSIEIADSVSFLSLSDVSDSTYTGKDGFVPTVNETTGKLELKEFSGGTGGTTATQVEAETAGEVSETNRNNVKMFTARSFRWAWNKMLTLANTVTGVWTFPKIILKNGTNDVTLLAPNKATGEYVVATTSDIVTNLILFPTTADSDVSGYKKLVTDTSDASYDTVAVNVPTGVITGSDILISSLVSAANLLSGNPGVFEVSVTGNIRRISGTADGSFYFKVFHRDLLGTETLICTSDVTAAVNSSSYVEFSTKAIWNNGDFISTDRIVYKFYGNKSGAGSNPSFEFQFGGTSPVRSTVPLSATVLLAPIYEQINNIDLQYVLNKGKTAELPYGENVEITDDTFPANKLTFSSEFFRLEDGSDLMTIFSTGFARTNGSTSVNVIIEPPTGATGAGVINFRDVGDNTKNVAWKEEVDLKADLVDGTVPASQLPAYVDDVVEYANLAAFPVTGVSGKIYVALDTNKTYRWSGSTYVALDEGVVLGETSSTAYRGDRGKTAYDHSQASGNPHGTTASQVGAYTTTQVDNLINTTIKSTTASSSVTGTTSESILVSILVSGNKFSIGDILQLWTRTTKTGTAGTATIRYRVNTSNTLTGSILLSTTTYALSSTLSQEAHRFLSLRTGNVLAVYPAASAAAYGNASSGTTETTTTLDPTADFYLFITIQLGNSADSVVASSYFLSKT